MQATSAAFRPIPVRTGVLVVGAGPTGLALACDLRSRGVAVTIIDKADGPATTSRALGLQPRGIEILDRLGALGDLPQRAVNATGLNIFVGNRRLVHLGLPARPGVAISGPLIIGQAEIEAQLRARLAGLQREVAWQTELVRVVQTGSGIEITLRDADGEATLHADWLVGCDGAHSRTRKLADIAFDGTAFAERFLLADVQIDWDRPHREIALWMHADGMFAAMPLPGPNSWRVMVELPAAVGGGSDHAGSSLPDADAVAIVQRLLRERAGDLRARVRDPSWVSLFRFHRRLASSYRRGRIFLAGDAAHIHSPFGGQGMNTGLGDAYNLGWKLAMVMQGRAADSLLDTYEVERRPVAREVLARTTNNTNMLLGNSVLARLVRDLVFLPMLKLPAVQRKMTAKGSQLGVNYRGGPLARGAGVLRRLIGAFGSGPRAGDRAPDAACHALPAGEATTLGRETCSGWALLLFGGHRQEMTACAEAARSRFGKTVRVVRIVRGNEAADSTQAGLGDITLEDRAAEIARLYGCRDGGIVLLRPDGHLAWRAASPKPADLARWLSRVFDGDAALAALSWPAVQSASG